MDRWTEGPMDRGTEGPKRLDAVPVIRSSGHPVLRSIRSSHDNRSRRCAVESHQPQRQAAEMVVAGWRFTEQESFHDHDSLLEQRTMRAVMSGVELLHRQVIHPDESYAEPR